VPYPQHHLQGLYARQPIQAEPLGLVHHPQVQSGLYEQGAKLDIIAMKSMLDWSAYKEVKLGTELVTSLGRDMLLPVEFFSQHLCSSTSLFFSSED
jgi:hypothetical protein